jgi:hypothetical protein
VESSLSIRHRCWFEVAVTTMRCLDHNWPGLCDHDLWPGAVSADPTVASSMSALLLPERLVHFHLLASLESLLGQVAQQSARSTPLMRA